MLRWMVESSQRLRFIIVILAVAVIAAGFWQLPKAPKEILPEFAPVYVEVQTEALGLSAAEVENLVTVPIEQLLLNGVAWIDEIHSESVTGLSSVVLIFEPGTDQLRARQMVAERLTRTRLLPQVSKPPQMLQPLSSASRVVMVRLSSTDLSLTDVSVLARWNIRPALMGVPGIANVSIWGERNQQLQVQVDPERLNAAGVTMQQIIATTGNSLWVSPLTYLQASSPGSGGFIDTPQQRLGVQHISPITSPESLMLLPIEGCTAPDRSTCPTLGDVATIVEGHQPLIGDAVSPDENGLLLVIEKFPGADTAQVTADVERMLQQMQPGLTGIVVDTSVFQRSDLISSFIDNTVMALLVGLLLAVLLLALFMFDWRSAVITAITLPLAMISAALVLHLRGATFDMVVIAGLVLAIGVVIDDVVVDVDHIMRRVREHRAKGDARSVASVASDAALEVRSPLLPITVMILIAALPILFLGGLFDSFFLNGQSEAFVRPIVTSYVLAIMASMVVALIVTPVLATILVMRTGITQRSSPAAGWLQRRYDRLLRTTLPHVGIAAIAVVILLVAGLVQLPQLRAPDSIVPASRDRDLLINWEAAPGTSLPEMTRITDRVTEELRAVPGVENVAAHLGRALTSDRVVNVNSGELWVSVSSEADYDDTVNAVNEVVQGYPGLAHDVHTYLEERVQAVELSERDVVLRIYGFDPVQLRDSANEVLAVMAGIDGILAPRVELGSVEPEFRVEVDLAKAQEFGLTPGDVRRQAATLVTGLEVGSLFENRKVFEVVVVGVPEIRQSISTVEDLMLDSPSGDLVRLGDVASVLIVPVENVIRHDAVSRYVDVTANVSGRDTGAVVGDLKDRIEGIAFPYETHAEILSTYTEKSDARMSLLYAFLAVVIGFFLVMQAVISSWRLAISYVLSLPTAVVGGLVAAYLFDRDLTLGAIIGLVLVLALATRHGMMLIHRAEQLGIEEGIPLDQGLVQRAAQERLVPILMTTLATAVAVLPLVVRGSVPGFEILHPMAVVVLGGLVTSTIFNLFIGPSLFLRFAPRGRPREVDERRTYGYPASQATAD